MYKNILIKLATPISLYYLLRAVVFISSVLFFLEGEWVNAISTALIFVVMMIPQLLKQKYKTKTPLEMDIAISVFVFLTLYLGSARNFYERFPWFDGTLHFLSGILLGMIGFVLIYLLNQSNSEKIHLSPGFISFFAVSFSALISVLWEIYEFIGDSLFGFTMQESGIPDTMGDFIVNMVGALLVAFVGYLWMLRSRKLPFTDGKLSNSEDAI
jgi:hypothetical protein